MPSLKDLKNRISSVKSTRKITSAMKMVAGSKLRRAQENAESARPYAERMARVLSSLAMSLPKDLGSVPKLLAGTGKQDNVLLIVVTSDRGLCGAFNSSVVRESRRVIRQLEMDGRHVQILCIGRKGRDLLRQEHGKKIIHTVEDMGRKRLSFEDANIINAKVMALFDAGAIDVCQVVYNRFNSVISQVVTVKQLIPFAIETDSGDGRLEPVVGVEFEPNEKVILESLLPRALAVSMYGVLLESAAGEQGARMTAMDNATRNAGDMIDKLTLNYNRSRQAYITNELIEIISGAEAI
ncbi:MAG: F0F1 ATP synthase subunit gamma [Alphaproteobacteria bacterium]|nr:F0F1 ATP synthase subunit gamma [Alphaproteobacteria bacterium]